VTTGIPVWRDVVPSAALASLDSRITDYLDRRPDVLVIGGGMLGLATAHCCARAGLGRVLLLERDGLASGPSGRAAALLTPEAHVWTDPPPFVDLARRSFDLWRSIDDELGGALGVEPADWIIALPEAVPPGSSVGEGVEVLDRDAAHALEPELGPGIGGALRIPDQGRVHPLVAAGVFAKHAGQVACGVEVIGIDVASSKVATVRTSAGDVEPGAVVFATGLAPDFLGVEIPQRLVKGHLLATSPAPFRLHGTLAALDGLVVPLPSGELVAGGTLDEGDDEPVVRPDVVEGIRQALVALLPRVADLEVAHAWCCFRPMVSDGQPVIDRVPGVDNAWITCGHYRTGILMAPGTGDVLARWIATGEAPAEVAAFSLARFG
jgi:glycine oxidase